MNPQKYAAGESTLKHPSAEEQGATSRESTIPTVDPTSTLEPLTQPVLSSKVGAEGAAQKGAASLSQKELTSAGTEPEQKKS
jgi:hypothetical protein